MPATTTIPHPFLTPAGEFTADAWKLLHAAVQRSPCPPAGRAELLQEAAVMLLRIGRRYDPAKARPGTFVFHVVRWTRGRLHARDRRWQARERLPADLPGRVGDDDDDEPAGVAELRAALGRLPADGRGLVCQRYGLGGTDPLPLAELAAARGVTRQAVGGRLDRLLGTLAADLGAG